MHKFVALAFFAAVAAAAGSGGTVASAAPVPKHLLKEAENPDLAARQGQWTLTGIALDGMRLDVLDQLDLTMEFNGNTLVATVAKQNLRTTGPIKLDATANPRRLMSSEGTATDLDGKPVKNEEAGKPSTIIYKIEGDTLTLASNAGNQNEAPKDFVGKDGANVVTMTFTRVKK